MERNWMRILTLLIACATLFAGAQAATLAELFGIEEGSAESGATPAPDADPFAQAKVAIEAPMPSIGPNPVLDGMPFKLFEGQKAPEDLALIPESAIEDDGVVRVLLRSLGAPKLLNLTLKGCYTVENDPGFRFMPDTEIQVANVDGSVYLGVEGLVLNMGGGLTLTRQASEGENGIYIAESEKNALYPGDLRVMAEQSWLQCVLSIPMEDYLQGVIAYEMSDAWPIEALKSQAVAARTYALQRKLAAENEDFDVYDTTLDQVFKGVNAEYTTVAEAVRETAGVIGVDANGDPANCWYSASNGGTVAIPTDVWVDKEDVDYIRHKEDPYDLENPLSIVNALAVSPDAHESEALQKLLQAALEEAHPEAAGIEFAEICALEPIEETREGSGMYQKLRVTVTARLPESEDETRTEVELSVYEDVKQTLGLGVNPSDTEICSAREENGMFILEMRRYGHGVGMSQRGAQRMAGVYEKNWQEILDFYFPGMRLERVNWNAPELAAVETLPEGLGMGRPKPTPLPTPGPLPELKEGEYYAVISLGDDGSLMNLRKLPTTQSEIITQLADGQRLVVGSETADENGWVPVHTAEYSGYAKLNYLIREE